MLGCFGSSLLDLKECDTEVGLKLADRQIDRQTDRQIYRQADRNISYPYRKE